MSDVPYKITPKLLSWASILDGKALDQAATLAKLPFIFKHVALMPDAHPGMGATIGSVIATQGAIIPSAVGVDLGCGMAALPTNLTANDLPDDLDVVLRSFEEKIPAGVGQGHEQQLAGEAWIAENNSETVRKKQWADRAIAQYGTLGSGNHFIEVCLDEDDRVWLMLHSGSRGVGNKLAQMHITGAKKEMKRFFIDIPDPDLAYFVQGTPEFTAYIEDLNWAQKYAAANRQRMLDIAFGVIRDVVPGATSGEAVNCHHNYAAQENHMGTNVWVTRKGAISAREGEMGIIPGSMGTRSYIVKGLGHPASFTSAPHGAGRTMSRSQAKRDFTVSDLEKLMVGKTWLSDKAEALLDEIPTSYKDIDVVMEDSHNLVTVVHELRQIVNYKGA